MSEWVVSVAAIVLTFVLGGVGALLKFSITRTIKSLEDRIDGADKDRKESTTQIDQEERETRGKVHELELVVTRLTGEMNLLRSQHDHTQSDLKELESKIVTRDEFRAYMRQLENGMAQILSQLGGRGRSPTPGPIPRTDSPIPPRDPRAR